MISYLVTSKFTRLGNIRSRKTSNRLIERIISGFRLFLVTLLAIRNVDDETYLVEGRLVSPARLCGNVKY